MGQALETMRRWFAGPAPGFLADDVEWRVPGYPVPQDTYRGPQEVFGAFFPALTSQFAAWGADTEAMIESADGEHVTVIGRYRGTTHGGQPVGIPFIHVWTVRGGRITRVVSAADTAKFAQALR